MVKVFEPMLAKALLKDAFIESIAVSIPIRAIIPNEMIITVNTVRSRFSRMDCKEILKFSKNILLLFDIILRNNDLIISDLSNIISLVMVY